MIYSRFASKVFPPSRLTMARTPKGYARYPYVISTFPFGSAATLPGEAARGLPFVQASSTPESGSAGSHRAHDFPPSYEYAIRFGPSLKRTYASQCS